MTYEEVEVGQHVLINTAQPRFRKYGIVRAKEVVRICGKDIERIYVDTNEGGVVTGRRLCVPSVLVPQ